MMTKAWDGYNERASRLIQLVASLRAIGAHADTCLPTVVVCGNQSVGKSSLIQAISGVALPRSDGTCTRCVTEVRISPMSGSSQTSTPMPTLANSTGAADAISDGTSSKELELTESKDEDNKHEWSCSVRLRFEYDELKNVPLSSPREVAFAGPVRHPNEVEELVKCAQRALLNPSLEPSSFIILDNNSNRSDNAKTPSMQPKDELKFSRNVVCLDIHGANVPVGLSLIDLPGIIRSVDRAEDTPFIDMVQGLVRAYISNERAIIVAVISCKDEIENQAIVHVRSYYV